MIARPVALAGLLGAAVGGPYLASKAPDEWSNPWDQPAAEAPAEQNAWAGSDAHLRSPDLSAPAGPGSEIYESPAPLAGPVGISLEQALDWNVTKNWVYRQWARKSTGLSDPMLFGVRVPLVTGSGMTDVAGSLTYYFDRAGGLQRMRLLGRTADTSRIAHLATTRFGMQPRTPASAGDQLFQIAERKQLRGQLLTRPEGVLWATSPHSSFSIDFEATRPGSGLIVTPPTPQLELPAGVVKQSVENSQRADQYGEPVLPARSLVPDAPAKAVNVEEAGGEASETAAAPADGLRTPKLPKLGAPTAAPPAKIAPLDGYRDRFRWPG